MVTFKAEELKDIVSKCTCFSSTSGVIPEHGYLYFREGHIIAETGVIGIKYKNPVDFPEEYALPAEVFSRLLLSPNVENRQVNLKKEKEEKGEGYTAFKAGRLRIKIPDLPRAYAIDITVPPEDTFIPLPDEFSNAINQVLFSVPQDDKVKEALRGIYYDGKSFYASDNIKLSRFTPNFDLDKLFIPNQLLEHLVEDKPLSYCITTESDGSGKLLWFLFKDYAIYTNFRGSAYPMSAEIFERLLAKKPESAIVSADPQILKDTVSTISILAEQYMNRVNIVAFKNELAFYVETPSGLEGIEPISVTSNVNEGDRAELVAVDINYLKEVVDKCSDFFFTPDFVYFSNEAGLESVLKPLGVEDGPKVMARVGKYYETEDGTTTGVDTSNSGGIGGAESSQA